MMDGWTDGGQALSSCGEIHNGAIGKMGGGGIPLSWLKYPLIMQPVADG